MSGRGIKSNGKHPYQRFVHPFWRYNNLPPTLGYSEATKEQFEFKKLDFEQSCKYIQWETKPKV